KRLTKSGMIVGTPAFMAPEQARGQPVDCRGDLFSLGALLYLLCTGTEPFPGETPMAQLTALAVEEPRPILELNPSLPAPLAALIMRLLSKRPADRPASAQEVADELERMGPALRDLPPDARRTVPTSVLGQARANSS